MPGGSILPTAYRRTSSPRCPGSRASLVIARQGRRRQDQRRHQSRRLARQARAPCRDLDADFGLGNIDVMLGPHADAAPRPLPVGRAPARDIIDRGAARREIFPAGTGIRALTALTAGQWTKLAGSSSGWRSVSTFCLIDTAAGISDNVVELLLLADRVIVVTSFEPAAVVDAYCHGEVCSRPRRRPRTWGVLLFLGLKLTQQIDWSWWWITAPLWSVFLGIFTYSFFLAFAPHSRTDMAQLIRIRQDLIVWTEQIKTAGLAFVELRDGRSFAIVPQVQAGAAGSGAAGAHRGRDAVRGAGRHGFGCTGSDTRRATRTAVKGPDDVIGEKAEPEEQAGIRLTRGEPE